MAEPASEPDTRQSLLLRLRDLQDAQAWQLFVNSYAPLIYRWCRRHELQEADAVDVAQDVLIQVVRSIRTFAYQPERGRFRDWLGVVVRSKLAHFHHRQARDERAVGGSGSEWLFEDLPAPDTDTAWTAEFNAHIVRIALERIRPNYEPHSWRAFEMVWLQNQPIARAAQVLDMHASAVCVAKWRVLRRLREEILTLAEDIPHLVPLGEAAS